MHNYRTDLCPTATIHPAQAPIPGGQQSGSHQPPRADQEAVDREDQVKQPVGYGSKAR